MSRQTRANNSDSDSRHSSLELISNQNQQLFELYLRKTKQNEKHVKNLIDKATALMKKKIELKMKLMRRESKARIAVIAAVVIAAISADAFKNRSMNEKDDLINEILAEVQALNVRYAELSQKEIVKIFLNKFKLINLYRLRHMRDLQYNKLNDMNRIEIENEMLRLRKIFDIYKNFDKHFHEM
jgi:hypothetical protein